MSGYVELHEKAPQRELYVLSIDREDLDIEELRWLGRWSRHTPPG